MKWRQTTVLRTALKMRIFIRNHAGMLPVVHGSPTHRELDAAARALVGCRAAQVFEASRRTSLTKVKNKRRQELIVLHMRPIVAVAQRRTRTGASPTPAIGKFRMPPRRTSDAALVHKARAIADAAARYKVAFVAQTFPADFATQARAAAQALQGAMDDCSLSLANRVKATKEAAHQTLVLRDAIRATSRLVHSELHRANRSGLLEAWKEVVRYGRKPGVKRRRGAGRSAR